MKRYFILIIFISLLLVIVIKNNIVNNQANKEILLGDSNILGDADGNGKVNISDYMLIRKHILGTSKLNSNQEKRADVNRDNKINQYDYMIVRKSILYGIPIEEEKTTSTEIKVTKVELNKATIALVKGGSETLVATISPSNATNKEVTWTSSNNSVATVDANGKVIGVKEGNAIITVKTKDGEKVATCTVTVSNVVVKVTKVELNKTTIALVKGGSETLVATISPSNATNKEVTWTSSNNSVATVDANGKVIGVKEGNAIITVKTKDGDKVATCTVTVSSTTKKATKIHFINTGGSNAFLLESNGHYALLDSSEPYNEGTVWDQPIELYSVSHVIRYLRQLGVNKLDVVIASHGHSDHIGGMKQIADNFVDGNTKYYYRTFNSTIEEVNNINKSDWYYERAVNAMRDNGAQLVEVTNKKNVAFKLGEFDVSILNTETVRDNEWTTQNGKYYINGVNKDSLAVFVKYGDYKVLFAHDMEKEDEMDVANIVGKVDILQMGHHGATTSSQHAFLDIVQPKIVVIPTEDVKFDIYYRAIGRVRYAEKYYGAKAYIPARGKDAVVANCKSNSCTIDSNEGLINWKVTSSGSWEKIDDDGKITWLHYNNGGVPEENVWIQEGGNWYYCDEGGHMAMGWEQIPPKGPWYYFDETTGVMQKGWKSIYYDGAYRWFYFDPASGKMVTGWQTLSWNGKTAKYHFNENGVCDSTNC